MKFTNKFKIILWATLVGLLSYPMAMRLSSLINGSANASDIAVFIIWVAILVSPLFQEFAFFGVSWKREIDKLRTDVKEQMITLRSDIRNTITASANISPIINLGVPATDSQLESLEETTHPLIKQELKKKGIDKQTLVHELEISDDIQYLFAVRYTIEKELNNLANVTWVWMPDEKGLTPQPTILANALLEKNVINPPLHSALREVLIICNRAIHGRTPDSKAVKFVRTMAPDIIAALKYLAQGKPKE